MTLGEEPCRLANVLENIVAHAHVRGSRLYRKGRVVRGDETKLVQIRVVLCDGIEVDTDHASALALEYLEVTPQSHGIFAVLGSPATDVDHHMSWLHESVDPCVEQHGAVQIGKSPEPGLRIEAPLQAFRLRGAASCRRAGRHRLCHQLGVWGDHGLS